MLAALGGESEIVTVVHESHWAVGWVEWIAIEADGSSESDVALEIADQQMARLDDYPVLNEEDYSEEEQKEAEVIWRECYRTQDRIAYIRKYPYQFEFCDFVDMLGCVRGNYFAGYASDLINH
jgi:hypothetical protein